ncbi:hypothetical protein PR003_g13905 [Phytophthora rubi]|nr:hypothetical protein PR003_g13905 [Phytophthora rubi]
MNEMALQQTNDDEKKSQQARVQANEVLVDTVRITWWGEFHLYTVARMTKAADNAFVAAREAVKKRERCSRLLKREEKNLSKSTASLAAAQAEFEAAKVCEEDALELKEILVRPVFAMTKDIASKGKSVNTPLYHAARQVFEEVMPAVIGFYDDK